MNAKLRNGIIIATVGIILILAGITVFYLFVSTAYKPIEQPTPVLPPTKMVVVASRDMALGTLIAAGDLTLVEVPENIIPRDAILDIALVVNRRLKSAVVAGEMLLEHKLANPTNVNHDIAYELPDDKVLMAFLPSDLMTSLSILERGDIVDILVTMPVPVEVTNQQPLNNQTGTNQPQTEVRTFTFDAMQKVSITAIVADIQTQGEAQPAVPNAPTPTPALSAIKIKALLLALSPQDALLLKNLKDTGAIFDLVLRSPTSEALFETTPILTEYIRDRYGLEIPRQP